ncbi:MAG: hypothetical protein ACRBG0_19280 [Lewinella sp.]|uniref:hypothetical protein n=1 Tax=Lewinella sp. TaxID=2004506 RepID=UPI003D6BA9D2
MKTILAIIILGLGICAHGQECDNIIEVIDEFSGETFYKTNPQTIHYPNLDDHLNYYILKDEKFAFMALTAGTVNTDCLTERSKIIFKNAQGEFLEVPHSSRGIECGRTHSFSIRLTDEVMDFLSDSELDMIRLFFSDSTKDYKLTDFLKRVIYGVKKINPKVQLRQTIACIK